jgi:hypothetical protein
MLARKDMSLKDIVNVLKEFRENIGDGAAEPASQEDRPTNTATGEAAAQHIILDGLLTFLEQV